VLKCCCLQVKLPRHGPAGEVATVCDRYLFVDNGKKCVKIWHLPSAKSVGKLQPLDGDVIMFHTKFDVDLATVALR
jgi:hypothetical protein